MHVHAKHIQIFNNYIRCSKKVSLELSCQFCYFIKLSIASTAVKMSQLEENDQYVSRG